MGKYIGPDNTYGLFQKQKISIVNGPVSGPAVLMEYTLDYRVPVSAGLLVVAFGAVLEADVDYTIADSGKKIVLAWDIASQFYTGTGSPGDILGEIFVVFLGKQLSVTNSRVLIQATSTDLTDNTLETNHALAPGRVQVFKNGTLLSLDTGYTIVGTQIVLTDALSSSDKLDVYVNVI